MRITCGFFIINDKEEILLCHPTNSPHNTFSIPKGLINDGESELEAACRETLEETGIDLLSLGLINNYGYIGRSIYKHGKKCLVGFYCNLNYDIKKCICNSFVELTDSKFPEVDYFKSVPIKDAYALLHHTQRELLNVHMNLQ